MIWTAAVDLYCERTGPDFWAEPLNAVSNLAFIAAGLIAAREARRSGQMDAVIAALCLLALSIGIGSFLFHTVAQRWAGLADVIPILLFIVLYLLTAIRRFLGWPWLLAAPAAAIAFTAAVSLRPLVIRISEGVPLNGSDGYVPALALLLASALTLALKRHPATGRIALATTIFAVSLTARTLDPVLCQALPTGTHFLWHLLNGTMIGVLLLAMVRHGHKP